MFIVDSLDVEIPFSVFLLDQTSRLVITDIDGTITESDVKGFVFPQLGIEAHQVHLYLSNALILLLFFPSYTRALVHLFD